MEKLNLRNSTSEVRNAFRAQVKRLRKQGRTYPEIVEITGLSLKTATRYGTSDEIEEKSRGRKSGEKRTLTIEQEKEIRQSIIDKRPDQLKLPFALWTRKAVALLIKDKLGIEMPIRTIGSYLERWGFTPQKALKKAYEQRPQEVKDWLDTTYPKIKLQAASEGAEIFWADETGIRNDDQCCRGYAPKGKTPVLTTNGQRFRTNMVSAISNQGKIHFMIYQEKMNADVFIRFLNNLIEDTKKKLVVIVDNLRVHHSKIVKAWLDDKENKKKISVHFLPSYSPELNPDEYLNCDLKGEINRRPPVRTAEAHLSNTECCMNTIKADPNRIVKYFKHKSIQYAAA